MAQDFSSAVEEEKKRLLVGVQTPSLPTVPPTVGSGLSGMVTSGALPPPIPTPGGGVITADSAKGAIEAPMQRPGGIFGTADVKGVNEIMARENKARGEMIDNMVRSNGGNGVAILPSPTTAASATPAIEPPAGMRSPRRVAEFVRGMAAIQAQERGQDLASQADMARNETARHGADISAQRAAGHDAVLMRGQDMTAANEAARIAGNPIDNKTKQLQLDSATQVAALQKQYMEETDPTKKAALAEQMRVLGGKDRAASFSAIHAAGGTYIDPKNPLQVMKHPDTVFKLNTLTGQMEPMTGGPQAERPAAPTLEAFAAQVRAKNPGKTITDEQIIAAHKQQFGG